MPLWAGRSLALVGIALLALNLRTAVAALSPIARLISADVPLDDSALGLLGMLPPVAFAASAIVAPMLSRRVGLERFVVVALVAAALGHLARALAGSFAMLFVGSLLVFIAMGIGNVLLPPLVKKYFPDRIGLVTSLYATVNAVGMAVPPLVAFPVADSAGWRASLGIWSVLALIAMFPWVGLVVQDRRARAGHGIETDSSTSVAPAAGLEARIWHSRTAWALALLFAVVSFHVYALFAWLPEMMTQVAGSSPAVAGTQLALYSALGLPLGMVVPIVTERMRNVSLLIHLGALCFVFGYLGLLIAPAVGAWLWVVLIRMGSVMFPACLVLINLRSSTPAGSAALSGYVQGVGYTLAAVGPLVVGLLHDATGGWTAAFLLLIATVAVAVIAGVMLRVPHTVEDELARHRQRHHTLSAP